MRRLHSCGRYSGRRGEDVVGELYSAFDTRVDREKGAIGEEQQEWLVYQSVQTPFKVMGMQERTVAITYTPANPDAVMIHWHISLASDDLPPR